MKRVQVITMMTMVLISQWALAQPRPVALNEAIQLGIRNSKGLKIAAAKALEAGEVLNEARLRQYPDIKVSGAYMRLAQPHIDFKLPLGSQSNEGGEGEGAAASGLKVNQAMYGIANVSLPLYAGLRIKNGIESARLLKHAAELDAEHDQEQVVQDIVAAYYNLYKAQVALGLVKENQKQAEQRVADFTNLEKNGLLARNDLLKAQLQESNVALAVLDAENNFKVSNYNMNLLLGLDTGTELKADDLELGKMRKIQSWEDWQSLALQNRADYLALDERGRAGALNVRIAKADKYPSLALTGGYVAAYIPHVIAVTNAVNGGLGFSYNLASLYKSNTKIRQAKAQEEQLHWSSEKLADGIRSQVYSAYQGYLQSVQKIAVCKQAVEQAAENYRISNNKYKNSLLTTTELLDADVAQLQAGLNYEFARADAEVAFSRLSEAAGTLDKPKE